LPKFTNKATGNNQTTKTIDGHDSGNKNMKPIMEANNNVKQDNKNAMVNKQPIKSNNGEPKLTLSQPNKAIIDTKTAGQTEVIKTEAVKQDNGPTKKPSYEELFGNNV
jgi:hypothetical protein